MKKHLLAPSHSTRSQGSWMKGAMALLLLLSVAIAQPLQPVNLGSTANFAILSASLISNVPTSMITGDIGLSPATGGNITGFGPNEISGTIYTTDASGPAGSVAAASMLTTAQGDLTIAYTDAANRTPVPAGTFLNPGSGDIGGLTLGPGLYKFTSGVLVSITGDVTLSGSSTDVWFFQVATTLSVDNGVHIVLAGGAQAANIFWQVGTSATLGTTVVFQGTIIADQSISLGTGTRVEGRLLASIAAVTIESSTVTVPGLVTSVDDAEMLPEVAILSQNFPNPFNPSTTINYQLPVSSQVTLTITDMLGREVDVLVNDVQSAGNHQIEWNASNYSSGTYFYRLQAGNFVSVKQMILVK